MLIAFFLKKIEKYNLILVKSYKIIDLLNYINKILEQIFKLY